MDAENTLVVVALIPYFLMVLWCLFVLASQWAWGSPSGVSDPVFGLLALVLPVSSQAVAIALPPFGLFTALSLGLLFFLMKGGDDVSREATKRDLEVRLAEAEAALLRDPKNAAACLYLAETREARGESDLALAAYEKAHALNDRTLPAPTLAQHRQRLASTTPVFSKKSLPEFEQGILAASVLFLFLDPWRGLALGALSGFSLWLRRRT